jgi:UDP-N-acetylglucosamine/UDP-N-acetylgalactosamine diphosphorylase
MCKDAHALNKLYHKAIKKVPHYDPKTQDTVKPTVNNGYKFELFIHNFLPFCEPGRFGVLQVVREDEFAPVKNAEGSN